MTDMFQSRAFTTRRKSVLSVTNVSNQRQHEINPLRGAQFTKETLFLFLMRGSALISVNDAVESAHGDTLSIVPPETRVQLQLRPGTLGILMRARLPLLVPEFEFHKLRIAGTACRTELVGILNNIDTELRQAQPQSDLAIEAYLSLLMVFLERNKSLRMRGNDSLTSPY
jgi:hypothetical protein